MQFLLGLKQKGSIYWQLLILVVVPLLWLLTSLLFCTTLEIAVYPPAFPTHLKEVLTVHRQMTRWGSTPRSGNSFPHVASATCFCPCRPWGKRRWNCSYLSPGGHLRKQEMAEQKE